MWRVIPLACVLVLPSGRLSEAHEGAWRAAQIRLARQSQAVAPAPQEADRCRLYLQVRDAVSGKPLPVLVRVTARGAAKPLVLEPLVQRPGGWYSAPERTVVEVPQQELRIEALHGIGTRVATRELDLRGKATASVQLQVERFFDPLSAGWHSGNTHVHLRRLSRADADRYLKLVGRTDNLDIVYVSHLRRADDERTYISNEYTAQDLHQMSTEQLKLRHGQEHRHNFGPFQEGYGHVMFLDIHQLVRPVSIGPGIMKTGTDGIPLNRGMQSARADGATVIWCHNTFGVEDLPNWMLGSIHAQNIFDGGNHGTYEDTFYRYLNLGLRVPFSTGTDWFVYDFSRVMVPLSGEPSSERWLKALRAGRSYITNGTFLEFTANGKPIGETLDISEPTTVRVRAKGWGRNSFAALQLVYNGLVIGQAKSQEANGLFEAVLDRSVPVDRPGWLAVRINPGQQKNEFGEELFAHTSPVYVTFRGRRAFDADVAHQLLREMEQNASIVARRGVYAADTEKQAVLDVHRRGIERLKALIAKQGQP